MRKKRNNIKANGPKILISKILLFIISIMFFILIYSNAYNNFKPININAIELIKKNNVEIKIVPEDSSGLIISYQNNTIYNSLNHNVKRENDGVIKNNYSQLENSEAALIVMRDNNHLLKNSLTQMNNDNASFLFFGFTSTKAATDRKLKRLLKTYTELIDYKINIYKISEGRYKIKSSIAMSHDNATKIALKIKKNGEECYVE